MITNEIETIISPRFLNIYLPRSAIGETSGLHKHFGYVAWNTLLTVYGDGRLSYCGNFIFRGLKRIYNAWAD
jgi:hypothetical protein